jgi:hypothetical protein
MSKTKNVAAMDEAVVSEALTRQVATVALTGASAAVIARQLTISPAAVRKIQAMDRYKELIAETAEEELAPALAKAKSQLARLSVKAVKVVERNLDQYLEDGKGGREALNAATIVLKAVGLHEEGEKQQDAVIQVVLPSGAEPVTYEVKSESEGI